MVPSSTASLPTAAVAAAAAAAAAASAHPVPVAWAPASPPRLDSIFTDSFDASPRNALSSFSLVPAPPIPPSLSLGAPASPRASPPPPQPAPPASAAPSHHASASAVVLTPEAVKPVPMLQDHTNQPLSPMILSPQHDTRLLSTDSRRRRQLRIQHRRRVRRNAPPTRPQRLAPVADAAAITRRAARVIRNREVALRARQKQKALMKSLESENYTLKSRATSLEEENCTLKSQIEMLRRGSSFLDL